jgi:glutamine synthetase
MTASNVLKFMKEKEVEFVDLRFTDPRGKLQHLTMDNTIVDEEMLNEGVFFDGSSIAGWKAINESDMILKPDTSRLVMDPFTSHNTLILFCDILDAVKRSPYERDPRGTAKKAEEYLIKSGVGDKAFFGPEPEFFVLTIQELHMLMVIWVIDLQLKVDTFQCLLLTVNKT